MVPSTPKGKRGGKRPGAGRPEGSKNKVTIELRGAAQVFAQDALETLHEVCMRGTSDAARVTAACAILDRAYGKPTQQVDINSDAPRFVVGIKREMFEDEEAFERECLGMTNTGQRPMPPT